MLSGRSAGANARSIFSPGTEEGWLGPADVFLSVCHTSALAFIDCRCGAQPPPRSHELGRLRPLTANICGRLMEAAWKQFWGERWSLALRMITLY